MWRTADTLAWIERLLTSSGDLIKLFEKLYKKHLVYLTLCPCWDKREQCCTKAWVQFTAGNVLDSSCLRPAVPLAWEGRLGGIDGSRIIFAMTMIKNAVVGAACVQDCLMQWKYFRNPTIPCQSRHTCIFFEHLSYAMSCIDVPLMSYRDALYAM